jgi:Zn-dependent protease
MTIFSIFKEGPAFALIFLIGVIVSISVHEFAHAWTANYFGDETPRLQGRLTLNPLAHLDPIGSIAFILLGFGWGKPVIYNPMRLTKRVYELLIALAGPFSNLLFAIFLNLIIFLLNGRWSNFAIALDITAQLNIIIGAFNLIPIPPLDGSSIIAYFWPEYRSLFAGQLGLIILLVLIFSGFLNIFVTPLITIFNLVSHLFGLI